MRVFIDGAAGTTGLDIEARLATRPEFELLRLDDDCRKDQDARRDMLNAADVAILCLPDEAAREAVALLDNPATRVIDASSAHRTAPGWTYGFPELGLDVASALLVSNPGCYPTGFLALVAPLVRAGIVPRDITLSVNAVSGYSGGGKALIERFDDQRDLAFRGYGFSLNHKHLPEMQRYAGLDRSPVFSPSVARAFRGMIVDVPLAAATLGKSISRGDIVGTLAAAFEGCSLVRVHDLQPEELLLHANAQPWDWLDLYVFADRAETQFRLVAALDNLGKGASGAAVQSLNLMAGLPETMGLRV